jgi:hypothetical protein
VASEAASGCLICGDPVAHRTEIGTRPAWDKRRPDGVATIRVYGSKPRAANVSRRKANGCARRLSQSVDELLGILLLQASHHLEMRAACELEGRNRLAQLMSHGCRECPQRPLGPASPLSTSGTPSVRPSTSSSPWLETSRLLAFAAAEVGMRDVALDRRAA